MPLFIPNSLADLRRAVLRLTVLRRRVVFLRFGAARRLVERLRVVFLRRAGERRRLAVVLRRAVVFLRLVVFLLAIFFPPLEFERRALLVHLVVDLRVRLVAFLDLAFRRGFRITTSCSGMTLD